MKTLALISIITLLGFTSFGQRNSYHDHKSTNQAPREYNSKNYKSEKSNHSKVAANSPKSSSYNKSQYNRNYNSTKSHPQTNYNSTRNSNSNAYSKNSYTKNYHSSPKYGVNNHRHHATYTKPVSYNYPTHHYHNRSYDYRKPVRHWDNHYYRPYRVPTYRHIVWTNDMYRNYRVWYPYNTWNISVGTSIYSISDWDAEYYVGRVARVYGKVYETYYDYNTNSYYLYFSAPYPYHKFSVVIPGDTRYLYRTDPLRYFDNEFVEVTGLITEFNGKAEIIVHNPGQIDRY